MEIVVIANLILFAIVSGIGGFLGFDIREWRGWLFSLYGFVSGFLIGCVFVDWIGGIKLGLLFAFAVMFTGVTTYKHRQRFK